MTVFIFHKLDVDFRVAKLLKKMVFLSCLDIIQVNSYNWSHTSIFSILLGKYKLFLSNKAFLFILIHLRQCSMFVYNS